jgi:putative glycosyltransferase (TIGR04372 family)
MFNRSIRIVCSQIAETIRRPSRLIYGPLMRWIRFLVRRPQLVPTILPLVPDSLIKRTGARSMWFAAGQELFQRDRPDEAWLCVQRGLSMGHPSIDEYQLGALCLFHGLGRFRDAMTLLACANERGLQEAAHLGLGNLPFRVLDSVWTRHFGQIALIDYVIKLGILEGRRREDTILYVPPGAAVGNRFLLDQIASQLRLIERPADLPFPESAVQALHFDLLVPRLADNSSTYYWEIADQTYQRWQRDGREPLCRLPPEIEARGRAVLEELGMPRDAWFVTLHVREGTWKGRPGIQGIRNAAVSTYLPAISEITSRGGWVVRIGDPSMTRLPTLANVIDYCHCAMRADWMDVFLLARCRFFVGTNSGPTFVATLYGTPVVLTNWWPAAERPWHSSDIFVPKMLRRVSNGCYLSLGETLREPYCWCYSRWYLANRTGATVKDNDPQIIRDAVNEMLQRLDGDLAADDRVAELRARADRIYKSHGIAGQAQLAGEFLRRNEAFLV